MTSCLAAYSKDNTKFCVDDDIICKENIENSHHQHIVYSHDYSKDIYD